MSGTKNILPQDLPSHSVLLDIRDDLELMGAPLGNLALGHTVVQLSFDALEAGEIPELPNTECVVVCATGTLAPLAAAYLEAEGIQAHVLLGGVQAWRAHNKAMSDAAEA